MRIPEGLDWLEDSPEGRDWLIRLPGIVDGVHPGVVAHQGGRPVPVRASRRSRCPPGIATATDAVLKVQFPDRESRHEAAALELWDGDGAVRLLAHDAAPLRRS